MTGIAIVGGGVGGISLARLLIEADIGPVTVFEAAERPGGKSLTFYGGDAVAEMGTCYTTLSHSIVKSWMREKRINLRRMGKAQFDGRKFTAYVNQAGGAPFAIQALGFFRAGARLKRAVEAPDPSQRVLDEAGMTTLEWLRMMNMPKVERFLHRMVTIMGYGFLEETPIIQAHRWCDPQLLASGMFNLIHMPEEGWTEFWCRLAEDIDLRLSSPVTGFSRNDNGVIVETPAGQAQFDQLVCAIPLDEFARLGSTTQEERWIAESINWQGYTTSLIASDNWFRDWQTEGYSDAVRPGAGLGPLVGARLEDHEPELGGHLYVTGQLSRGLEPSEVREIAEAHFAGAGIRITNFIDQKCWKYFPQYKPEAVRAGLITRMKNIQGVQRTWYTGATFSHEAVSHIVKFNAGLARQMKVSLTQSASATR